MAIQIWVEYFGNVMGIMQISEIFLQAIIFNLGNNKWCPIRLSSFILNSYQNICSQQYVFRANVPDLKYGLKLAFGYSTERIKVLCALQKYGLITKGNSNICMHCNDNTYVSYSTTHSILCTSFKFSNKINLLTLKEFFCTISNATIFYIFFFLLKCYTYKR